MRNVILAIALLTSGNLLHAQEPTTPNDPISNAVDGIHGQCHVDSRVDVSIRVYINGQYRGTIGPWGDIFPFVNCNGVTQLYAVSTCGRYSWSHSVFGDVGDYHWVIRP